MAITAERIGLDSIWTGDLISSTATTAARRAGREAWSVLAGLTRSQRVELGPLVAATSYNPAMLAKKAATVDEISGRRLILGLGAGWNRTEYDAYGFSYDHPGEPLRGAFTIIRTLLSTGAATSTAPTTASMTASCCHVDRGPVARH